ncbi:permease prefix domain 1-containing protein [Humibacter sp.]|uniref:permease prefix domain 1-containing protein n=1 Tax=Humibacter sp. TaxID=1940291 RepID=UPI003F7E5768
MTSDRIDAYLDDMFDRLEGTAAERRRMLSETETHLRDSADALQRGGMDADAAQSAAIAAFGEARMIASASNRRRPAELLAAFVRAAAQLGVYGFAAIGAAAVLARGLALVTSTQWVYGAPAGYRFTAAQCAHWLAVQPSASNCHVAAAMESSDDSFLFVLAAAIIGLIVAGVILGALRLVRRRASGAVSRLPRYVVAAIGATAFLGAGIALIAAGAVDGVSRVAWGQGVLYTDGAVALIFGIVFLVRFLLTIRPVSGAAAA